jgi:hypothetical protein
MAIRTHFQIVNAVGQPATTFSFSDEAKARLVASALAQAGFPCSVIKLEQVYEPIVPITTPGFDLKPQEQLISLAFPGA